MKHSTSNSAPGLKSWTFTVIGFGLPTGVLYSLRGNWLSGMAGGLLAGVLFATIMRWFAAHLRKRFVTQRPDFGDESILYEGPANHFQGAEGVGGYLWLTTEQLCFRSHRFNIQNHECRIPLAGIAAVEATRTLGIIPNGLVVHTESGATERFVVHGNRSWTAEISNARASRLGSGR